MDPLTHMVTGALVAQTLSPEEHRFAFALVAAGAGVVPDIDFLARKAEQKLLFLKLHRGFTHSLAALPIIGVCAAGSGNLLFGAPFWPLFLASVLAAASHLLLDVIMHATGLQLLWPLRRKISLNLVVGLNPLTSSARCGERSLSVCMRCTMHSAVLSPLVLLLWTGFAAALVWPQWALISGATLALGGLYLLFCQALRWRAAAVMRGFLRREGGDEAASELASLRVFPNGFNPRAWLAVTDLRSGHRVRAVDALGGEVSTVAEHGPSAEGPEVEVTRQTDTVEHFLQNAVVPHVTVYPPLGDGRGTLVIWRDLAFAFSPTVSLFAARLELDEAGAVTSEEFRERWDHAPEGQMAS